MQSLDDWKKSMHLMKHLQHAVKLVPRLGAGGMNVIKWHVDASHAVHEDCRGQTGAVVTLVKSTICNTSTKQKLNTRSSAETELVGSDDTMPQLLWMNCFLESQGHSTQDTLMGRDNESAMPLEKNGKVASSKKSNTLMLDTSL